LIDVTYSIGGLSALNAVACTYAEDLPVIAMHDKGART
jgi:TPP-dependent 2-oxoacid decarboxylase